MRNFKMFRPLMIIDQNNMRLCTICQNIDWMKKYEMLYYTIETLFCENKLCVHNPLVRGSPKLQNRQNKVEDDYMS